MQRLDLTTPDWLLTYGWRVPGGGPAVNSRGGQPLVSLKPNAQNPEASVLRSEVGSIHSLGLVQSPVSLK